MSSSRHSGLCRAIFALGIDDCRYVPSVRAGVALVAERAGAVSLSDTMRRRGSSSYEIARYGTLIAWADELGRDDVVRLLTTNLNEEKAADKKLSTVALRKGVNRKAAS